MTTPMDVEAFTRDEGVAALIAGLKTSCENKAFSDVLDGEGRQYVDLVLQGGGMLGVALVGYTYALEQAGLRFRSVAGTSAGAINALLVAASGPPASSRSERILKHLASVEFGSFLDGPSACVAWSRALAARKGYKRIAWRLPWLLYHVKRRQGLHPGRVFHDWLRRIVQEEKVRTQADLNALMGVVPEGLTPRPGRDLQEDLFPDRMAGLFPGRLAIIAADIATKTKFVFPRMSSLVFEDPDAVDPTDYVRMSMSIPGFFEPVRLPKVDPTGAFAGLSDEEEREKVADFNQAWREKASLQLSDEFREHVFVDGGVISNFPIAEFHAHDRIPLMPTFGAKLGPIRQERDLPTVGLLDLGISTFDSARQALDFDFFHRNPDYHQLVEVIDTLGESWLNFDMAPEARVRLFRQGVAAGATFLNRFEWDKYKETRAKLVEARAAAPGPPRDGALQQAGS